MKNPMDLTGKKILITGASSGIGRAAALLAADLGAKCTLVARNEKRLSELNDALPVRGTVFPFDLSRPDEVAKGFAELFRQEGPYDGLVYAAGIGPGVPMAFHDLSAMREVMDINYFSFIELAKVFQKKRHYNPPSSIVAVSSVIAFRGHAGTVSYSGSKGAIISSMYSMAMELVPKGIRVNTICPANVKTPMFEQGVVDVAEDEARWDEIVRNQQPMGLIEPEDVANAICFLVSPASRFVTGTNMIVDAGCLAQIKS